MFVKSIKIAKESMFPIFRLEQQGTAAKIGVEGTGFFINSKGYFVSAAHVFDRASQNTKFLYIGKLPEHVHNPRLEIREIIRDDSHDIFIGKIDINNPIYFYLAKDIPEEGRSICIGGYPLAEIQNNVQGGLSLGGVRRYFQPSFVLDKIIVNTRGRHIVREHDGFMIRDQGLFGMSGGPVFDKKGVVLGMQASVLQPRVSKNSSGRTITVENAVAIRTGLIIDLLKMNQIRYNLLGRF